MKTLKEKILEKEFGLTKWQSVPKGELAEFQMRWKAFTQQLEEVDELENENASLREKLKK